MTYEDASDGTYQDDLDNFADLSEKQQLTSTIGATVRGNEWNAGWLVDRIDVVDPAVTGAAVKFSRQPQLTLSWAKYGEDWNLFASGDATEFTRTTTGLTSSDPSEGSRVSSDFKAEYPIQRGFGSLTPAALGFARWSQATRGATTQEDEYLAYGVSIDGRLHFENFRSNGSLHEMIPRAKLSVRELNKNPAIVKFDTPDTANDIDKVSQIFLDNPVSGGDFVGDTRDVALSLTARGINANGLETYRISAGQTIYFQNRGVTLSGDPENADRGPLVIESAAQLGKSFNWNTRFRSVTDGETMDTATNEFKYQTSDTDYMTQRIVWENDASTRADHYISSQVNPNWRFLAGLQWEPDIQERVNQVVGIEYEGCCWRAAMIHAYERDKVTETNGGHSMKLQVELKGLGVLGRGTSSILERLREGYELFESQN